MGAILSDDLKKEGYELVRQLEAALPMTVWVLDLEIERQRVVTAAELAVLKLVESGVKEVALLTRLLGMRTDERLVERVLVRLLAENAIESTLPAFTLTCTGVAWKAEGNATGREHVQHAVRHDPVCDALEWMDHERPTRSTKSTWTIEAPEPDPETPLRRKAALGELVRTELLPDEDEKAPRERRGPVDLRGVAIVSRSTHWRTVELDVYRHAARGDRRLVAHLGGAEHPELSRLLAGMDMDEKRKRLVMERH